METRILELPDGRARKGHDQRAPSPCVPRADLMEVHEPVLDSIHDSP